ncbi:MAG TPA: hypothetical protein VL358_05380 [Caulobacteraceae bacterium]|jgi:hypothetical protein|nr:hypothetical protein [Caulobacteraceae bacterium]
MTYEVHHARFSPKDVARITGLSQTMQRDWRRVGYLPAREGGWSSFSLGEIAAIGLRKVVADSKLGPGAADLIFGSEAAVAAINSIVWWALEADDASAWITGSDAALKAEIEKHSNNDHFDLVSAVAGIATSERARLLILDPISGAVTLVMQEPRADEDAPFLSRITISLAYLGAQIAARAETPLALFTRLTNDRGGG